MIAPQGLKQIEEFYGAAYPYLRVDGTVSPLWEHRMVTVAFPRPIALGWLVRDEVVLVSHARVNVAISAETAALFKAWSDAGVWDYLVTYDGGYAWRSKRASQKLSMHAYGGALDFNANTNALGSRGDMPKEVVKIAKDRGWTWGGEWERPDPMHFQYARGY